MMFRMLVWSLFPLLLASTACDKKAKTSDQPSGETAANPQRSCTHLIAKLSSCARGKDLNLRFSFDSLKDWMYEDCEKLKVENKALFDKLMSCVNSDCPQMESCLEGVLGKWQENRK